MKKTFVFKSKYILYGIIVLSVVFFAAALLLLVDIWERSDGRFPEASDIEHILTYNEKEYVKKDNIETFLVLGLDKFEGESTADSYNNDKQADFLALFVFDNEAKKGTVIHINRDTMTDINVLGVSGSKVGTVYKQIALSHTFGNGKEVSCRNAANAVSGLLLGSKVDHFISVTMDSVSVLNDLVDGVPVEVLDDFTGIDDTLVKGETVRLLGNQALTYVRTRRGLSDSSNVNRMKRQKQYIESLINELKRSINEDDEFVIEASLKMADYIVCDRSVTQLQDLARKINTYEFVDNSGITGEEKVGKEFIEFYANSDSITKLVVEWFYEEKH